MHAGPAVSSACGGAASDVLLDAAHNPAGARALADYLREIGWTDVTLVVGVMRDKDVSGMLSALLPCCTTLVCTTPPSPRALAAEALAVPRLGMPVRSHACRGHPRPGDGHRRRVQGRRRESSPPDRSFSSVPCVVFFDDFPRVGPERVRASRRAAGANPSHASPNPAHRRARAPLASSGCFP